MSALCEPNLDYRAVLYNASALHNDYAMDMMTISCSKRDCDVKPPTAVVRGAHHPVVAHDVVAGVSRPNHVTD